MLSKSFYQTRIWAVRVYWIYLLSRCVDKCWRDFVIQTTTRVLESKIFLDHQSAQQCSTQKFRFTKAVLQLGGQEICQIRFFLAFLAIFYFFPVSPTLPSFLSPECDTATKNMKSQPFFPQTGINCRRILSPFFHHYADHNWRPNYPSRCATASKQILCHVDQQSQFHPVLRVPYTLQRVVRSKQVWVSEKSLHPSEREENQTQRIGVAVRLSQQLPFQNTQLPLRVILAQQFCAGMEAGAHIQALVSCRGLKVSPLGDQRQCAFHKVVDSRSSFETRYFRWHNQPESQDTDS